MFRFFAKLALPFFCLCCSVVWMFYDMHQIPQGNEDFQLRDLQSPKNWLTPIAFNPRKARETVLSGEVDFKAINCKDELRCWVAGSYGNTIVTLTTDDGGLTWKKFAEFRTAEGRLGIHLAADLQHGWAVGENGTSLATRDGGNTWQVQARPTNEWLNAIYMAADLQHGWAVGSFGAIFATDNGGDTWQHIASTASYRAMSFANRDKGWAAGITSHREEVFSTSDDYGKAWQEVAIPQGKWIQSIHPSYDAKQIAILSGDDETEGAAANRLLISRDAGKTWQESNLKKVTQERDQSFLNVYFSSDFSKGWLLATSGEIWASVDSGNTWKK